MDRRADFPPDFQLILASRSPRRHSLLREIGVPFSVAPSGAEETFEGQSPQAIAEDNALSKLQAAAPPSGVVSGAFVLATDTIVSADSRIMGKPVDEDEAADMLRLLSGRTHEVISGVALGRVLGGSAGGTSPSSFSQTLVRSAVTRVTFNRLDEADIDAYIASGDWRGKAGAYAIQGLAGLHSPGIEGEYSNVVGLPLQLLAGMFRELGFDLVRRQWL